MTNNYFEYDEEKALKEGFEEATDNDELFDVVAWKMERERSRPK